ncbi:MAG: ATP-binding protein [bacterium]|nr:ATP-binding protein [bacterium]
MLVIEEPETSIHAGAVGAVVDLIRHATRATQVVVTTHSPEVLDADWIEGRHLRIVEWEGGATGIARPSQATGQALREGIMGAGS